MSSAKVMRILFPGLLLLLGVCLAVWLLRPGQDPVPPAPSEKAKPGGELPRLVGSWFVRYLSDPRAYLDVATDPPVGEGLARVTAHLTGPKKTYPDIELKYNPVDGEWQMTRDPLPTPLTGGTWWVSQVGLFMADGRWVRYHADDPFGTYQVDHGGRGGSPVTGEISDTWIGSFYATEQDVERPRFTVHTFPAPGGKKSNPILQVYLPSDPVGWIAVNDDPDVDQDYARVTLPLTPGQTYLIRVDDRYHELGDYCLVVSRSAEVKVPGSAARAGEGDDTHGQARPIKEGEVRCQAFSRREGVWGDEDWLKFQVPAAAAQR